MSQSLAVLPNGLTLEEEDRLVQLLEKLNGKQMGTRACDAVCKKTVTPAIEAVCLRLRHTHLDQGSGSFPCVEVYMVERALTDTAYPGLKHCPGSMKRTGEKDQDVLDRLAKKEFGGEILSAQFVTNLDHPTEARGHFLSIVYLCVLNEVAKGLRGAWYPVDNLPLGVVECHRYRIIPAAVGAFVAQNTNICT